MPKQYLTIRDWSGGTNNRKDPRDIQDNECSLIQNMSIDALGKIKTSGALYAHSKDTDGSTDLSEYFVERTATLAGSGGYGLFYFESDHSKDTTNPTSGIGGRVFNVVTGSIGSGTAAINTPATSNPGGGYGLFYFESDHSKDSTYTITDTKHSGTSNALTLGSAVGNIKFVAKQVGGDTTTTAPEYDPE